MATCIFTGEETRNFYKKRPVSKDAMAFARWYRDKLNVQQSSKKAALLKAGVVNKKADNQVNLISCFNLFIEMKNKSYSWDKIKETLKDELMKKGLLTDVEYFSETY